MIEATEHSNKPIKSTKRRKVEIRELKESKSLPKETEGNQDNVDCSSIQPQTDTNTTTSIDTPMKVKRRTAPARTAKKKGKIVSEQSGISEEAEVVKKSKVITRKPVTPKKTAAAKEGKIIASRPTSSKKAQAVKKSKTVTKLPPVSEELLAIKKSDGRKKTRKTKDVFGIPHSNVPGHEPAGVYPQSADKKNAVKPPNLSLLRSLAAFRGPQLTPDGKGIDLSPDKLPSPETPHTPYTPDPDEYPDKKHLHIFQKKIDRGLLAPSYTPFDIVSGGRPPKLSKAEKDFWIERKGRGFVQENLPDRYGRLWRCVKMLGDDFPEDLEWDKAATRGSEGENIGPGSAAEIFEREVELFLDAFGEELPQWSVLEDVEKLDFGED